MATKKKTTKVKAKAKGFKQWKVVAIVSIVLNILLLGGGGVFYMNKQIMATAPEYAIYRMNNAITEFDNACQPENLNAMFSELEKSYDETGGAMVRAWNEFNCDRFGSAEGETSNEYADDLNKYLKSQDLPKIENLEKHQL